MKLKLRRINVPEPSFAVASSWEEYYDKLVQLVKDELGVELLPEEVKMLFDAAYDSLSMVYDIDTAADVHHLDPCCACDHPIDECRDYRQSHDIENEGCPLVWFGQFTPTRELNQAVAYPLGYLLPLYAAARSQGLVALVNVVPD